LTQASIVCVVLAPDAASAYVVAAAARTATSAVPIAILRFTPYPLVVTPRADRRREKRL
jgi:hypothetical protein